MKKKQKMWKSLAISIVIGILMIIVLTFYAGLLEQELDEETVDTLEEISAQTVAILNEKISGEFELLFEVADRLAGREVFEPVEIAESLQAISERHSCKRMGIIMPDGQAYTTDGQVVNLGERDF